MKKTIDIKYPSSLAHSLRLTGKEFADEIKRTTLVKLYEMGKVSSSVASKALGISRLDFFNLLANYKVSILGDVEKEDLLEDIENA